MANKQIHTKGGHLVKKFRKLKKPMVRYENYTMVYAGRILNDYTQKWQACQWDINGLVINRNVPKYDIDINLINN